MRESHLTFFTSAPVSVRIAWLALGFTCFQSTFLVPMLVFFPGQRTNCFSGLLCGLSLVAALLAAKARKPPWQWPEVLVCLGLSGLTIASSFFSSDPFGSGLRAFVLLSSGLGGFWCARILLCDPSGQERFQWLCLALLVAAIFWGLAGYFTLGRPSYIFGDHEHPVNNVFLMLWIGPLALIARGGRVAIGIGSVVLGLSYVVLLLSDKMAAIWMPLLAMGIGAALTIGRGGRVVALFLALVGIAASLSVFFVPGRYAVKSPSMWFRAENYPYSLHIAKSHPVLGIGLYAEREQFLENYEIRYPGITKGQFQEMLKTNRTPENTFLTFMTDLGFPFLVLYMGSLAHLLWSLFGSLNVKPREPFMNPLVLVIPIAAGLLYFQVYDGLIYPQINWFFHLLLGMIPTAAVRDTWDHPTPLDDP